MGKESSAYRALESAVISGLSERAHITGASAKHAHIQVPDLLDAIFHRGLLWAVEDYLEECREHNRLVIAEVFTRKADQ